MATVLDGSTFSFLFFGCCGPLVLRPRGRPPGPPRPRGSNRAQALRNSNIKVEWKHNVDPEEYIIIDNIAEEANPQFANHIKNTLFVFVGASLDVVVVDSYYTK